MKHLYSLVLAALIGLQLVLPGCAAPLTPNAKPTPQPISAPNQNNGVWLGHAFVTTNSVIKNVPQVADFLHEHGVSTWFVNVGLIDGEGKFNATVMPKAVDFLNAVAAWEKTSGHKVKVLAWLNGTLDAASPRALNLAKPEVRAEIVHASLRFLDPAQANSYIAGAQRGFDGVQYDLEPSGEIEKATALGALLDELRTQAPAGTLTSFCAHKYGVGQGRYWWSPALFYQLAPKVDLLCVMSYDTGFTDEAKFRSWMTEQVTGIVHAVSGAYWQNDAAHPRPRATPQIIVGFPGFPANKHHDLKAETMSAATQGAWAGVESLRAKQDPDLAYLGGAAVYLYTDGTGKDGYSSAADWQTFKQQWQKSP